MVRALSLQETKMRRNLLIAGLVAAHLGVLLFIIVLLRQPTIEKWLHPPQVNLPEDSEIMSMRASFLGEGSEGIDEFDVPPEHIPRILYWFRNSSYHPNMNVKINPLLGRLKINTREGQTRVFTYYDWGVNPILFTENNVDFFCGGGTVEPFHDAEGNEISGGLGYCGIIVVSNSIKEAHSEARKRKKSKPLP
jgi:hypothetical protein